MAKLLFNSISCQVNSKFYNWTPFLYHLSSTIFYAYQRHIFPFKIYFIHHVITVVPFLPPPSLLCPVLHHPSHHSCPWVIHISSLASMFPILFLTSPWLFCTYHLCFFFWYIYWLCCYSCPISTPSLNSILLTPSLPHSPPIVHVHGSYL